MNAYHEFEKEIKNLINVVLERKPTKKNPNVFNFEMLKFLGVNKGPF